MRKLYLLFLLIVSMVFSAKADNPGIYICNEAGWSEVALYAWPTNDILPAWPGVVSNGTVEKWGKTYLAFNLNSDFFGSQLNFIANNNNNGSQLDLMSTTLGNDPIYITISSDGNSLSYTIDTDPDSTPNQMYIIGNINNWNIASPLLMNKNGDIFTYTGDFPASDNSGLSYFAFTSVQNSDWSVTNANRWGPASSGTAITVGANVSNPVDGTGDVSFTIPSGRYTITFDFANKTVTAEEVSEPTPENMYIIGSFNSWDLSNKIQMTKNGDTFIYNGALGTSGTIYFSFTESNSTTWDVVNAVRHGPAQNGNYVSVNNSYEVNGLGDTNFTIDGGNYFLEYNFAQKSLTIKNTLPEVTLAQAVSQTNGTELIVTNDLSLYNTATTINGNQTYFATDGSNYVAVQTDLDLTGGIKGGFVATVNKNGANTTLVVDQAESKQVASYNVASLSINDSYAPEAFQVHTVTGYYQEVGGKSVLAQFSGLYGSGDIYANYELNTAGVGYTFTIGTQYAITAFVTYNASGTGNSAPRKAATDTRFVINPLNAQQIIPTGISDINSAAPEKTIEGIYNVNGQKVTNAGNGIFIIRYTDGSAQKVRF